MIRIGLGLMVVGGWMTGGAMASPVFALGGLIFSIAGLIACVVGARILAHGR